VTRLPSIASRLSRAVLVSALLWSLAVSAAVWLAVRHEMLELLDETLISAATVIAGPLGVGQLPSATSPAASWPGSHAENHFVWQLVVNDPEGHAHVRTGSPEAPSVALLPTPTAGLVDTADWRVAGMALGGGRMLYVAQANDERDEATFDVALNAAFATLAIALLAHLWLRSLTTRELQPLERLSERLATHDLLAPGATLGPAERRELQPVHAAIDSLAAQLSRRVAHERTFAAHAAHALRTPLAGIDAQLATALRDAPPELQPRLQRSRTAAARLQRVVAALLALFRSGAEPDRRRLDLAELVARLPSDGLAVEVQATQPLSADPDLLSAAIANLLDNALRHGATQLRISTPAPQLLRLADNGPGVDEARRAMLQSAVDDAAYDGHTGLGLRLADMVARAHGGHLRLPPTPTGFAVELQLGTAVSPPPPPNTP